MADTANYRSHRTARKTLLLALLTKVTSTLTAPAIELHRVDLINVPRRVDVLTHTMYTPQILTIYSQGPNGASAGYAPELCQHKVVLQHRALSAFQEHATCQWVTYADLNHCMTQLPTCMHVLPVSANSVLHEPQQCCHVSNECVACNPQET